MHNKYSSVRGVWYHNQLNGVALLNDSNNQYMCFKDGMYIDMSKGNVNASFYFYMFMSNACIATVVALILFEYYEYTGIPVVFYWIMCCCTSSTRYIWRTRNLDSVFHKL